MIDCIEMMLTESAEEIQRLKLENKRLKDEVHELRVAGTNRNYEVMPPPQNY